MGQTFTDSNWKAQIKLKPELRTNNTFSVIGEYCEAKPYIEDKTEIKLFYVKDNTSIKIATPSYISYSYPKFRLVSSKKTIDITQQSADNSYGIISLTLDYNTFNEAKFELQVKDSEEPDTGFTNTGLIIQFRIVKDTIVIPLGFTEDILPNSNTTFNPSFNWSIGVNLDRRFGIKVQNGFLDSALDIKAGITQVKPSECYPSLYKNFKNNPYNISDYSVLDVSKVTKGYYISYTNKVTDGIIYYFDLKEIGLTSITGTSNIASGDYCYFRSSFNNDKKMFNTNTVSDSYCSLMFAKNLTISVNPAKTVTCYEYQSITVNCVANLTKGSTPQKLTFTWQKQTVGSSNWVQVYTNTMDTAGLTGDSTYIISNPTIKESGTLYRCVISYSSSEGSESITTTSAKLVVQQAGLDITSFDAFLVNTDGSLSSAKELYNYSNVKFVCKWNDLPDLYKGSNSNLSVDWQFKRDATWKTVASSDIDFDRDNAISSIVVKDIYYSQKTIAAKAHLKLTYSEGEKTYTIDEITTPELSLPVKEPKISPALTTTPVITKVYTDNNIIKFKTNFITSLTYSNILVDDANANTILDRKCVVEYMVLFYQNNNPIKIFNFKSAVGDWQVQEISEFKAADEDDTSQLLQKIFDKDKHTLTFKLVWNNNFSSIQGGLQPITNYTNVKVRVKTRYKHSEADNDFTEIISENDMTAWESDKAILDVKSDTAIVQRDENGMATAISVDKSESFELVVNTIPVIDKDTDQVVWCIDGEVTDKDTFENEVHGILNKNDTGQYINWYVQEASDKQNNKTISVKFKKDVGA